MHHSTMTPPKPDNSTIQTNKQQHRQWDSWSQKKTPESYFYKETITMQRTQKQKAIQKLDKKVTKKDEIIKVQQVN